MKATYVFKYLPQHTSRVYVMAVNKSNQKDPQYLYSRTTAFLTQSLYLKERNEHRNVLVAFHTDTVLSYCLPQILLERRSLNHILDVECIASSSENEVGTARLHITPLDSVITHTHLLGIPLLVYMNAHCDMEHKTDVYDVFFYDGHNKK